MFPPTSLRAPTAIQVILILLVATCQACSAPPAPQDTFGQDTRSFSPGVELVGLGPGDLLRVNVLGQPEVSTPVEGIRVARDGTISLPLVGEVNAQGRTPAELRQALEEGLRKYYHRPSVAVSVIQHGAQHFFVMGQVKHSGSFVIERPLTLLEGLSMSEQLLPGANRQEIALVRRHGSALEVHLFDADTPGPEGMALIRSGDLIFVSRTGVGRFRDEALPILQALGYTAAQIAAMTIVAGD
jgi:polysaccharide export outer membrane protein